MERMLKYPKVLDITHEALKNITKGEVIIEEKIDGSIVRILLEKDNKIRIGTKNVDDIAIIEGDELIILKEQNLFFKAIQTIYDLRDRIRETINKHFFSKNEDFKQIYLFGEYLRDKKHNVLAYSRIPKNHIVLFDIIALRSDNRIVKVANSGEKWIKHIIADEIGFERIPILYEGAWKEGILKELLKTKSVLGNELVEGVVIKNYTQTYPIDFISTKNYFGFHLVGKYVRDDFKEKLDKEWGKKKKHDSIEGVIEALLTEPRLNKAIQHLKEEGKIKNEKRDLKYLIPEFIDDTLLEEGEWIKKRLWEIFSNEFKRRATNFVVKTYLERLRKEVEEM